MRIVLGLIFAAAAITACGRSNTGTAPEPEPAAPVIEAPAAETPDAPELAALLAPLGLAADADGAVENACGARVAPMVLPAHLGAETGAWLIVIPGGPEAPSCYGDGPGSVSVLVPAGDEYTLALVHAGYIGILDTETGGMPDLALGGPGFSFPVVAWDGTHYVPAGRDVDNAAFATAVILP